MGQLTMNMCLLLHYLTWVNSQSFTSSFTSITSPHLNKLPKWPKLEVQELLVANGSKWCAVAEHPLSDDEDDDNDDDDGGDDGDDGGDDDDDDDDLGNERRLCVSNTYLGRGLLRIGLVGTNNNDDQWK